jgi:hypothetical protein
LVTTDKKQAVEKVYIFRRTDSHELVEMPFSAVLEQDSLGYITLPDGVQAKRCLWLEDQDQASKSQAVHTGINRFDLTFSLVFSKKQLPEMRQAAKDAGFSGVEFYPDPQNPNMVGIRCSSEAERERYIKHRGCFNKTGSLGSTLGKEDIAMAEKLVRERYGKEEECRPASRTKTRKGGDS